MTPSREPVQGWQDFAGWMADLASDMGLTQIAAIPDQPQQEALYAVAHALYEQARYEDALRAFSYLLLCSPFDRRYHIGTAGSFQMSGKPAKALRHWGIASLLDLTDAGCVVNLAVCSIVVGEVNRAREALDYALAQLGSDASHQGLRERISSLRQHLIAPGTPTPLESMEEDK